MRALFLLTLTFSLITPVIASAASAHKPATIRHHQTTETLDYRVRINPGVAEVGKSAIIQITLSQVLSEKDAALGNLKPINDATLTGVLVAPSGKKNYVARQGLSLRDAGTYGMTFTSNTEGVHAQVFALSWSRPDTNDVPFTCEALYRHYQQEFDL